MWAGSSSLSTTQQMDLKVYIVFKLTKDYFKHIPFLLYGIKYVPILITSTTMKMSFSHQISTVCTILAIIISAWFCQCRSESEEYQTYIIHMDQAHKPSSFLTHESWHCSILKSLLSSPVDDKELLLYSYNHVMHGFSASLTPS